MDGACKAGFPGAYKAGPSFLNKKIMTSEGEPIYRIQHLDLQQWLDKPDLSFLPGKAYWVFWWREIPLGHLYKEDSCIGDAGSRQAIWEAIQAALAHYAAEQKTVLSGLKAHFLEKKDEELLPVLEQLFSPYLIRPESLPSVSLVICTRNRTPFLASCLKALSELNYPPSEIIVVDNAPDDDSTEKLVSACPGIKYIKEQRKGLDYARNSGIKAAGCDIVAFTDDDVDLHPDWIWRMAQHFGDEQVQAVTGLVLAKELNSVSQCHFERYWSFNRGYRPVGYDSRYFEQHAPAGVPVWEIGAGANMAFRRKVLDAIGTFDVRLDMGAAGCNGDSEMWYRLLAEGWTIKYEPLAVAYHTHRRDLPGFKKQIYQYMRGFSAAILTEYFRYRNKGELIHLFRRLPPYFFKRIIKKLAFIPDGQSLTLWQESKGYLAGIFYYFRNRRKPPFDISYQQPFPETYIGETPLVSVVITTYNHANYLPEALDSMCRQTYPHIECHVVDDGSTDHTAELVKQYPDVNYFYQQNSGLAAARNTGIRLSKGDFILFLDADDWLYPDAVATQLRFFRRHPEAAFVAGSHDKVNDKKEILPFAESPAPQKDHFANLLLGNFIGMHAAVMYRRKLFDYFKYDIHLKACEDYDLYLRVSRLYTIAVHCGKIAAYRLHQHNMSADTRLMMMHIRKVLKKQYDILPIKDQYPLYKQGLKIWKSYYAVEAKRKRVMNAETALAL